MIVDNCLAIKLENAASHHFLVWAERHISTKYKKLLCKQASAQFLYFVDAWLNCYQHYTSIYIKNKEVFFVRIRKKVSIFIKKFMDCLVKYGLHVY